MEKRNKNEEIRDLGIDIEDEESHSKGKNEGDRHIQNRDRIYIF